MILVRFGDVRFWFARFVPESVIIRLDNGDDGFDDLAGLATELGEELVVHDFGFGLALISGNARSARNALPQAPRCSTGFLLTKAMKF